jgi:hypothetical protein
MHCFLKYRSMRSRTQIQIKKKCSSLVLLARVAQMLSGIDLIVYPSVAGPIPNVMLQTKGI